MQDCPKVSTSRWSSEGAEDDFEEVMPSKYCANLGTAEQSGATRGASSSADLYGSETLLPSPAQQPYQPALPPVAPHSQVVTPVMSPVSANTAANQ